MTPRWPSLALAVVVVVAAPVASGCSESGDGSGGDTPPSTVDEVDATPNDDPIADTTPYVALPGTDDGVGIVDEGAVDSETLDPADRWSSLLADAGTCPNQRRTDAPTSVLAQAGTCLVNHARRQRGLARLDRSDALDRSARIKAADVVRCDEFSHTACDRPVESPFEQSGFVAGCRSWRVGENLGYGERAGGSPRSIVLGWLRSPGHRRNLLGKQWQQQGMALVRLDEWTPTFDGEQRDARDVLVWVNHFGRARGC